MTYALSLFPFIFTLSFLYPIAGIDTNSALNLESDKPTIPIKLSANTEPTEESMKAINSFKATVASSSDNRLTQTRTNDYNLGKT